MRLLVTRPHEDGVSLDGILVAMGHRPIHEPLFAIKSTHTTLPDLERFSAVIFTSANGVRAFVAASTRCDLTAYAVGDRTADALREAGFANVFSAAGDSIALEKLISRHHGISDGPLLHVAGTEVAGALAENLRATGYEIERVPLYWACAIDDLSAEARQMLQAGRLDGVLFFSPRTAAVFERLIDRAGLVSTKKSLYAWCLSRAVAEQLRRSDYAKIFIAPKPTQPALLEMIDDNASGKQR